MTKLYARLLASLILLARKVPIRFSSLLDGAALTLVSLSRHLPPMSRQQLTQGVPFIGQAACEDFNCLHMWDLFIPHGAPPDIELHCPGCDQQTGVVV